jgi:hypothetical protein
VRAVATLALLLAACGTSGQARADEPPGPSVQQVQALQQQVEALQAEVRTLHQRLDAAEQRLGLQPYRPVGLKALNGDDRALEAGDASYVAEPGGRAAKRSLAKQIQGADVTVVSLWATWCVPCTSDAELVRLRALRAQLARQGVDLVSLAVDDLPKVQGHPRADRWLYPLWQRQDAHLKMLPRSLMQAVGVGLPVFLVVSRDATVRYYRNEALDDAAVGEIVTAALDVRGQ